MATKPQKWDVEVDFVSVGSGIGGLSAAIVAHDAGATAIVLEKSALVGGVTAHSFGEVWVPNNHVAKAAGLKDSREEALSHLEFLAGGFAIPELQAAFLDTAPIACQYFCEKVGIRLKVIKDFSDYHYPVAPGGVQQGRFLEIEPFKGADLGDWQKKTRMSPHVPNGITHDDMFGWGGSAAFAEWDFELMGKRLQEDYRTFGPGLVAAFAKAALLDRGVPAYLETPVRELIIDDGTVIGVRAEREGKDFYVRARKGVTLAIGGYDWNPELATYYEQMPKADWHSAAPPQVEGDNFILGGEIGAAIATVPPLNMAVLLGYHIPGEELEGKPVWRLLFESGFPHAILVNREGKRFGDESFYKDIQPKTHIWDGLKQEYTNFPPYLIVDQSYRDKYLLGTYQPGQPIPEELLKKGNTPQELAEKLGIDGEALAATIQRFNEFVPTGVDADFGRGSYPWANFMAGDLRVSPNPNLGALNKPPYYGMPLAQVATGINAGGLKVNANSQVMHVRGNPIPGLYAVGNSAAYLDLGAGYQSGFANCRGITWGYIAAKHATRR